MLCFGSSVDWFYHLDTPSTFLNYSHQWIRIGNCDNEAWEGTSNDENRKETLAREVIIIKVWIEKLPVLVSFIKNLNEIFLSLLFHGLVLFNWRKKWIYFFVSFALDQSKKVEKMLKEFYFWRVVNFHIAWLFKNICISGSPNKDAEDCM